MKNFSLYLIIPIFISLYSCEKELDVEVDSYDPQLVIEAKLSNRLGDAVVHLTNSLSLNEATTYQQVSDAQVSITEVASGQVYWLNEVVEGIYLNDSLIGRVGRTYALEVILPNGKRYSSVETMPEAVELTGITKEVLDISFTDDEDEEYFEIIPEFIDIEGVDNYYQLIATRDNEILEDVNVFKDLGFDGLPNTQRIVIEGNYEDEIKFDLHNITSSAYEYLLGVEYNLTQGSATPTNPVSNISGGALGYFKVYSANNPITIVL